MSSVASRGGTETRWWSTSCTTPSPAATMARSAGRGEPRSRTRGERERGVERGAKRPRLARYSLTTADGGRETIEVEAIGTIFLGPGPGAWADPGAAAR